MTIHKFVWSLLLWKSEEKVKVRNRNRFNSEWVLNSRVPLTKTRVIRVSSVRGRPDSRCVLFCLTLRGITSWRPTPHPAVTEELKTRHCFLMLLPAHTFNLLFIAKTAYIWQYSAKIIDPNVWGAENHWLKQRHLISASPMAHFDRVSF